MPNNVKLQPILSGQEGRQTASRALGLSNEGFLLKSNRM
jgi:hypothetical protein